MPDPSLLSICGIAGLSVFLVLSFLAGVFRLLNQLFPVPAKSDDSIDPAVIAVITEAVQSTYPGMKVVGIEEQK